MWTSNCCCFLASSVKHLIIWAVLHKEKAKHTHQLWALTYICPTTFGPRHMALHLTFLLDQYSACAKSKGSGKMTYLQSCLNLCYLQSCLNLCCFHLQYACTLLVLTHFTCSYLLSFQSLFFLPLGPLLSFFLQSLDLFSGLSLLLLSLKTKMNSKQW